jgi:hypothetical protein
MRDEYTDPGVLPRRPEPKTRSGRRRKRIREQGPVVPTGPSPAARALVRVVEWQKVIEAEGIDRAEIARRNGYTRARVTQLMSLLRLPDDLKTKLLGEDRDLAGWSVRRAIQAVPVRGQIAVSVSRSSAAR